MSPCECATGPSWVPVLSNRLCAMLSDATDGQSLECWHGNMFRRRGGFWWQLMDSGGVKVNPTGGWNSGQNQSVTPAACKAALDKVCVGANASATPSSWNRMQMYNVPNGGNSVTTQGFTDYTAEFLLTRGPFAILGCECSMINQCFPYCARTQQSWLFHRGFLPEKILTCDCAMCIRLVVRLYERRTDATACKRVG